MIKVSCIIATYNRAEYLERAIQSILKQTYKEIEIIVVDDGSTDNTKDVLKQFNIKYIYQENAGCWKARDKGIENSNGKYIAILDSDDYWLSLNKIKQQVEFLESNPEYVLTGGWMLKIKKGMCKYPETDEEIRKTMLFENPFSHSTVMYRKDAWKKVGGYCGVSSANDWHMWMRLGKIGKMYNFPKILTCYSTDSQNISQINAHSKSKDDIAMRKQYRYAYPNFQKAYILSWLSYYYYYFPFKKHNLKLLIPTLGMPSTSRMSLNVELNRQFKKLNPGIVLEVGSGYSTCNKYVPYTKYLTLDIDKKSNPDICSDLHNIKWKSNYFDTVIAVEVLEHIQNPQKAINEMMRILKPEGTCIISTRFIQAYHQGPKDYYRFTWDSLKDLFKDFGSVEIYHHGNKIQSVWHLINDGTNKSSIILNIFNSLIAKINSKKTKCPCGFVVVAKK